MEPLGMGPPGMEPQTLAPYAVLVWTQTLAPGAVQAYTQMEER